MEAAGIVVTVDGACFLDKLGEVEHKEADKEDEEEEVEEEQEDEEDKEEEDDDEEEEDSAEGDLEEEAAGHEDRVESAFPDVVEGVMPSLRLGTCCNGGIHNATRDVLNMCHGYKQGRGLL